MSERINQLIEENLFKNKCEWFSFINGELAEGDHGSLPHLRVMEEFEGAVEYYDLPNYWGEIEHAFLIVEKLNLTLTPSYDGWSVFQSNTSGSMRDINWIGTTNNQKWTKSKYATEAICLAALKMLNIEIPEEIS